MNAKPRTEPADFLEHFNAPELLDLVADGFYITDRDRRIVLWNRAAERITGWGAQEVVGHPCRDNILVHVDKDGNPLCGFEQCPLHRSIVTGQSSAEPLLVFAQHRSGKRIPVEVTVSPLRNRTGEVIGGIEIFRDLTESIQDQLRARDIQQVAVRCELPRDSRVTFETLYQPRTIVGGDFFRIEKLEEDHYAILVADAKGHGIAAALYTMLLQSLWHDHRTDLDAPTRFMGLINDRLHALVHDTGYFGTAVLAIYHAGTGHLRLVRAGHPAPLLFRSGGNAESIGVINPALGMFVATPFTESSSVLRPGDTLLLYTDGATELFDEQDNELGLEGLLKLAHSQETGIGNQFELHTLQAQLLRFSNEIHLPDDLTLVKISRTEPLINHP